MMENHLRQLIIGMSFFYWLVFLLGGLKPETKLACIYTKVVTNDVFRLKVAEDVTQDSMVNKFHGNYILLCSCSVVALMLMRLISYQ